MSTPKTYVPKSNAKVKPTQYGDVMKLGFHSESLVAFINQHTNEKGYINLDIVPRQKVDDYGNTHSVVLNDWKPNGQTERQATPQAAKQGFQQAKAAVQPQDDIPF